MDDLNEQVGIDITLPTEPNYGFYGNCEIVVEGDSVTVILDSAFPGSPEGDRITLHKAQVASLVARTLAKRYLSEDELTLFAKP